MKYLVSILFLTACNNPSKLDPKDNLACKAVHAYDEKADCTPYFTDVGERHTHSAVWVLDKKPIYCVVSDNTVGAICGSIIASSQQETHQAQPEVKAEPKVGK